MPPFISEWLDSSESLCCARTQHEGMISWQPNATFVREVGDEATLTAMLEASQPGISQQVRAAAVPPQPFTRMTAHAVLSRGNRRLASASAARRA